MRILVVGELSGSLAEAATIAIKKGIKILHAYEKDQALDMLRIGRGVEVVWYDLAIGQIETFLEALIHECICVPVIACGANISKEVIERAIIAGIKDFFNLPVNAEKIESILDNTTNAKRQVIYKSGSMQRIIDFCKRIAISEASVLITGESGTGKEVIANYIHDISKRTSKPFVSLNCAAIPETLLESELFGHEKGSFTGALCRRIGKFEEANGGTLFLDEISEMHPRLQAKLLRAIQERVIDRVGGTQPVHVNIRILATSNRNLLESVAKSDFREDLYFRLNVVNIHIPPLRERIDDLLPLAHYFIDHYTHVNRMERKVLSENAIQAMSEYPWKGNVRELENAMHRAVLLAQGEQIEPHDIFLAPQEGYLLPIEKSCFRPKSFVGRTILDMEKELIFSTLENCAGNRTHAATMLGISIRTLRNKLKGYEHVSDTKKRLSSLTEVSAIKASNPMRNEAV